ncbi:MAG: hypothetical protein AB1390_09335 [Nitrospirota bacterium]
MPIKKSFILLYFMISVLPCWALDIVVQNKTDYIFRARHQTCSEWTMIIPGFNKMVVPQSRHYEVEVEILKGENFTKKWVPLYKGIHAISYFTTVVHFLVENEWFRVSLLLYYRELPRGKKGRVYIKIPYNHILEPCGDGHFPM